MVFAYVQVAGNQRAELQLSVRQIPHTLNGCCGESKAPPERRSVRISIGSSVQFVREMSGPISRPLKKSLNGLTISAESWWKLHRRHCCKPMAKWPEPLDHE